MDKNGYCTSEQNVRPKEFTFSEVNRNAMNVEQEHFEWMKEHFIDDEIEEILDVSTDVDMSVSNVSNIDGLSF
jgi:hypothetical protein